MKQLFVRIAAALLATVMTFGVLACKKDSSAMEPAATEPEVQTAEPAAVPENGQPDKSAYPHVDAIEAYKKTDWTANWIWTSGCMDDSYVAFRKTFTLDSAPGNATAFISAVDKYVLWVNGELLVLDGSLKRGATPVDSYYDTVTIPNLVQGENTVALLVAFNGRSGDGSIVPVAKNEEGDPYNQAGLLFELHAGDTVIASGADWKAIRHAAFKNRVTGGKDYPKYDQSSMLAERNVYYVAADDIGTFWAADYYDAAWEDATLIAKPGDLPFGDLYYAMIQTPKFGELTDFANAADYVGKPLTDDTVLALEPLGNVQFTWEIELEAEAGKRLTVYTNTYTDRQGLANFKDTYVTRDGAQSYENWPWRSGSVLYIEAPAGVTFTRLAYRLSGFNGEWAGSFTSSDAELDQLWQESLNTIAICMRDTFMDCPERERGPYMGDATNEIDAALYSYDGEALDLIKKAILACIAWTNDSGAIPSRAPSVKPQEIPNQSLALVSSVYRYLLHSGDTVTVTAYYRVFADYLKLFEMGENGLPLYRAGSWTWNDWGNKIDVNLLQIGFYYYALRLTQQLADDLGIADDNAFLSGRMQSIEANWRAAYETDDGFKSPESAYIDDRANAMLALSGLADASDYAKIAAVLTATKEASPFTEKYVLEALCEMGYTDLALVRIKERYAPMLTDEWDTLWEQFNDETGTYNHGWTAAPLYILSKYVAGIRPTEAGWKSYEIAPSDVLASYTCSVWTQSGTITVEKNGTAVTITTIDGNGTVILPDGQTFAVTAAGTYSYTIGE